MLFSYLGFKALNENGWDGWGFGSSQTLVSSKYWAKDGFVKNYFLFLPRPYSKLIHYFDEPEFRNRPIENFNGELPRNRVYYTHYPPLYLAPYALLAKIGIESRATFRIFSILISLSALFLFYLFIKSISSRSVAVIASVYYGLSVTFLNYADSISIQPFTIFFTFLILYLSVFTAREFSAEGGSASGGENIKIYFKYNLIILASYFALSLSSYDATFFVFAWLVLYDAVILKKFPWKKWLIFALAPILGFTLQIFQNVWYLGWADTWQDIFTSYAGRAIGSLRGFISGLTAPFVSMTSIKTIFIFKKTIITFLSAITILGILWKFKEKIGLNLNYFKIILILAISAALQPFFINVTGHWPYQGVLTAPFWGLLVGTSSSFLLQYIAVLKYSKGKALFMTLFLIVLGLWSIRFYDTFNYVKDWPNNRPDQKVIEFSRVIKTIEPNSERLAFRIIPKNPIWKSSFPIFNMEYYMGMPTIDFANTKDLLVDFNWFQNRSEYPFYSFIISENKMEIESLRNEIKKTPPVSISEMKNIQGQYLFIVNLE